MGFAVGQAPEVRQHIEALKICEGSPICFAPGRLAWLAWAPGAADPAMN